MASLTSVELNYLVFRYLQESGFTHSAFVLGYEAGINKCNIDGNMAPPGALIKFVQKGLQYLEMEANLCNSDAEMEEDFSFFQPLDLITKDVSELQQMLRGRKRKDRDRDKDREKEREREKDKDKEPEGEHERERSRVKEKDRYEKQKEREREREKMEREKGREKQTEDPTDREMAVDQSDKGNAGDAEHGASTGAEPMDVVRISTFQTCNIPTSDVMILKGHSSEVSACAWSPTASLLASGSGDATARIWTIPEGTSRSGLHNGPLNVLMLKHVKGRTTDKSKDVTTLDWNGEGTLLATGSCDCQARIWTTNGELKSTLSKHKGPIFSLKWNKKGDYLLTGSVDKTAIVWDVKAEEWKQQFEFHTGPTLDVDWRNNVSFATSSTDSMIYLCKIGETRPVKTFAGHQCEVNCVKWDPTGSLLASCSDDITAKIWSIKQDNFVHDLREHSKEIYTIRWSPTGPGTNNPNQPLMLASASFDSTVKLWDVELGKMLSSLNGHTDHVYSIAFSPNGEYIASGSMDKSMHIWSIKEGKIVKTYAGDGGIFEVCWNNDGTKLAACFADNSVCVLDFRM
ncbi:PREDICTED: F-box-like/WD repeat-containing protein TBL1XR1 isoform X2 [Tarenaya hassleriana]|uniref:F-box-like/WD repeat-containing protein TBL1XR1 isoform X2 n=1 Tax=Tarenaya hassleriana TaxID=28532 RepID=UPI00053C86E2|nr:PREDICTED: F-box-like/WD repeat-containing protein TBL1XR1 isoform X2 [Tarenaya hassleriana]